MTQGDELSPNDDAALLARLALDDRPGPATRISSARAHALVDGAIDAVLAEITAAAPAPRVVPFAQRPWVRALAMAAVALLVLVGGAAAAKLVALLREETSPQPATHSTPSPKRAAPQAAAPHAAPVEALPEQPSALLDDGDDAREPRAHRAIPRGRDAREGVLDDLLQQANRARAAGEFADAAQLYAQVYEGRPSSLPAYVALVAAASLELEHLDHPARARKLFEAALRARPQGALDLEARQGLALALRDLGARNDEIAALRTLIARHPARPAAARARARLAELGE